MCHILITIHAVNGEKYSNIKNNSAELALPVQFLRHEREKRFVR